MIRRTESRFLCEPAYKETSLGIPLDDTSCHSRGVRKWPMSCVRSLGALSTTPEVAETAKIVFARRFIDHFSPASLIEAILEAEPYKQVRSRGMSLLERPSVHRAVRIPFGFHPLWEKAVANALHRFARSPSYCALFNMAYGTEERRVMDLRASWYNELPYLHSKVQRL